MTAKHKAEKQARRKKRMSAWLPHALRAVRKGLGLSRTVFAERLGVTKDLITRLENGRDRELFRAHLEDELDRHGIHMRPGIKACHVVTALCRTPKQILEAVKAHKKIKAANPYA